MAGDDDHPEPVTGSDTDQEIPDSRVSRRDFLAAAGVVATGAAVGAPGALAAGREHAKRKWNRTAGVVVVGTGAAAFSAALAARSAGNNVLMLEKAPAFGGTSIKSGGGYWIPNNSLMRANGLSDPKADAMRLMCRLSFPSVYDPDAPFNGLLEHDYKLIDAFYDNGSVAIDGLTKLGYESAGGQPSTALGGGEYYGHLPENKSRGGRGLGPKAGGGGAGMIAGMKKVADGLKIPILLNHRVMQLITNAKGEAIGVSATSGGRTVLVRAQKAVVFGSGGFTHNEELALHFLRGPIFGGCAAPTNTGDFIAIALEHGAGLGNMANAFFAEIPLEVALNFSSTPNDIWQPFGDSMIVVNRYGRRIYDEKFIYNERTQVHFYWDPVPGEYPNLLTFMIYDDRVRQNPSTWAFRWPVPLPGTNADYEISGGTLAELTQNISARLGQLAGRTSVSGRVLKSFHLDGAFLPTLEQTIARFNQFAVTGKDLEFGRGETAIQLNFNGPPGPGNNLPSPTMYPVASTGPYHCIILAAGTLDTKGGPKINEKAQVLKTNGKTIPGLYGAGNCIASAAGQAYWTAGGTLGPAITFGWIAGTNAAKERVKKE